MLVSYRFSGLVVVFDQPDISAPEDGGAAAVCLVVVEGLPNDDTLYIYTSSGSAVGRFNKDTSYVPHLVIS